MEKKEGGKTPLVSGSELKRGGLKKPRTKGGKVGHLYRGLEALFCSREGPHQKDRKHLDAGETQRMVFRNMGIVDFGTKLGVRGVKRKGSNFQSKSGAARKSRDLTFKGNRQGI